MKLKDLIGKKIVDVLVRHEPEPHGLDKADSFIVLDNGVTIGIPFGTDDQDAWIAEPDQLAVSLFKSSKWWQTKDKNTSDLKNRKIVDVISYPESTDKAFILLDNNKLITEITVAPHGTGHAGFWTYNSLTEIENKFGDTYIRLSAYNGND